MFIKLALVHAFAVSGLLVQTGRATTTSCIASPISVRLPPTFDGGSSTATWPIPPIDFDWGYWYQTVSSSANSFQRNLEYWTMPLDPVHSPAGAREELASFQLAADANPPNPTVYTSYGIDTPLAPVYPLSWNYTGTGIISAATNFLEVVAWGTDCDGVGYRVSHSTTTEATGTPATLDVLSRSVTGPDAITLANLKSALIGLGNSEITARANAWVAALHDSGRDGLPPVVSCDAECKINRNLLDILG